MKINLTNIRRQVGDEEMARLQRLIDAECSRCGADGGHWCLTSGGKKIQSIWNSHVERFDAAGLRH